MTRSLTLGIPTVRVQKWFKAENSVMRACLAASVRLQVDSLDDETLDAILHRHRLPGEFVMGQSDLHPLWRGRMMRRLEDGSIEEVWASDPPFLPGALDTTAIRHDADTCTPWHNRAFFDLLERGFPTPGAHPTEHALVLRPYTRDLYRAVFLWHAEARAGSAEDAYTRLFTSPTLNELPSFPFYVAVRANIPKPGQPGCWRMIVNHSMEMSDEMRLRAGWSMNKLDSSLNARIREAAELETDLKMTRPADVGHLIAIFESWGLQAAIVIADAKSYFHTFPVCPQRAFEQGTLSVDGAALSCVFDMGGTDCPAKTGAFSSFVAESVEALLDHTLTHDPATRGSMGLMAMRAGRSAKFGAGNKEARLAFATMYSDDLLIVCATHSVSAVEAAIKVKGDLFNVKWVMEKYGANLFIGRTFDTTPPGVQSRQHVNGAKLTAYAEFSEGLRSTGGGSFKDIDSLLGKLNHASTVELGIKPLTKSLTRCRFGQDKHDGRGTCRLSQAAHHDLRQVEMKLRRDEGLPIMCSTKLWPKHSDPGVITQRGDACLREDDGWNGWGIWWLVPSVSDSPNIFAAFGQWSALEERAFGRNIPAAEAVTALLGDRVVAHRQWWRSHHTGHLILSDSEGTYQKYSHLKAGSADMDACRDAFFALQQTKPGFAVLDHIPREYNVGADVLSKGHWELFQATMRAAGLPDPTLVTLTAHERDISHIIKELEQG